MLTVDTTYYKRKESLCTNDLLNKEPSVLMRFMNTVLSQCTVKIKKSYSFIFKILWNHLLLHRLYFYAFAANKHI